MTDMYRDWKRTAAVGLAVLLGCMMPVSTMPAAEAAEPEAADAVNVDAEPEAADAVNVDAEPEAADAVNVDAELEAAEVVNVNAEPEAADAVNADAEPEAADAVNVNAEPEAADAVNVNAEPKAADAANVNAEPEAADAVNVDAEPETAEAADAEPETPEIVITWGGENKALPLGGEITFDYTNNPGTPFTVSVGQNDQDLALFYYFDEAAEQQAKTEEQMSTLSWEAMTPPMNIPLSQDGRYVVYVKAEAGEKTYYARSGGVVVDTQSPVINGVEEGKTYPEGTRFQVEDANLDRVLVNEQTVSPENGEYKVTANGTSCVIRAKDKAGNEKTCSISVTEGEKPDTPDTPETDTTIAESKTYELKAGVKYHLAEGKWRLKGDKSVYQGGSDFYVTADGSYDFQNSLAE